MKKTFILLSFVLMVITASAQTSVTVDGIKYNLDGSTATVTYPNDSRPGSSNPSTYTGDIAPTRETLRFRLLLPWMKLPTM